jgi:PIN domain nuclease of toxin-antitoxin system
MGAVRVLLDTHALLWWLVNDRRLPETARAVIRDPDSVVLVSAASGWEIATKHRLGKLPEADEIAGNLPDLVRMGRMQEMPITLAHAMAAGALPGPHRDPFDRMLIAHSRLEGMPVVTNDPVFRKYDVEVIW